MLFKRILINIIPSIKSDHSAIVLIINSIENQTRGPSLWKFNASLLEDKEYIALINNRYQIWTQEFKDGSENVLGAHQIQD